MIVLNTRLARGFSFKPFIFLPDWLKRMGAKDTLLYFLHEVAHYSSQKPLPFVWCIRYFLNKKFRLEKETDAYAIELVVKAHLLGVDYGVLLNHYASVINAQYWRVSDHGTIKGILASKAKTLSENENTIRLREEIRQKVEEIEAAKREEKRKGRL